MIDKYCRQILHKGGNADVRHGRHCSTIAPRAKLEDKGQPALRCWRRNPHTGRLEMHWQVAYAGPPMSITPRLSPTPAPLSRIRVQALVYQNVLKASSRGGKLP